MDPKVCSCAGRCVVAAGTYCLCFDEIDPDRIIGKPLQKEVYKKQVKSI